MYVEVSVNVPQITGVFDYHLPPELAGQVQPGCLVVVPFGKQTVQGIVLQQVSEPQVAETRPVLALLDPLPVVTPAQLELARLLSAQTLSPLSVCLDLMVPVGISQHADTLYHLNLLLPDDASALTPAQQKLIAVLRQRGDLRGRQLQTAFPHMDWKESAQALVRRGILLSRSVLPSPSVRPKFVRTVQLTCSPECLEEQLDKLGKGEALARRQAILRFLVQEPWPVNVSWAYASSGGKLQDLLHLAEMGLVTLGETEVWRDPLENIEWVAQDPPPLTADQQAAWDAICRGVQSAATGDSQPPFLLYGVTGSGKTEIYLQAVAETLRQGRQAIVLVPEIALTPQTVRRFVSRFKGQVGLVHSRLSPGERFDTWRRARAGQLPVIVGPRSALFTPLPDPGLIVIDECHDDSYYQSEIPPYYNAVSAAIHYARQNHSVLLMGSATPGVNWLYRARVDNWPVLRLPVRILAHRQAVQSQLEVIGEAAGTITTEGEMAALPLPPVAVMDMREELKNGNRSIFSIALQNALKIVLDRHQQAILFLNRRGTATYVFCRDCGYSLRCPRCDFPLTYHTGEEALICHTCNYRRLLPQRCPQCGSNAIRQFGTGTEKVESELQALLPAARTLRWDAETARHKGAHEIILSHFSNHRADVLVGTQMLAKGLDLPLVTLVGVVLADVGLNLPDYRAGERVFQLLTQVAGRAGRSPLGGQVILQTYQPDHYAIQAAAAYDFDGFYEYELEQRRKLGYPPFSRLARLEHRQRDAEKAEAEASAMAQRVRYWIQEGRHSASEIIGPVPCFFNKLNSLYRWQIIVRSPDPAAILRGRPLGDWRIEIDPVSVL